VAKTKIDFSDKYAILNLTVPVAPRAFIGTADQGGASFFIDNSRPDYYSYCSEPAVPLLACIIPAGVFISGGMHGIY
jgi:hypothetical protein